MSQLKFEIVQLFDVSRYLLFAVHQLSKFFNLFKIFKPISTNLVTSMI